MTKLSHVINTGATGGQDWTLRTNVYQTADINSIDDTNGTGAGTVLTAIPSPFARLHLFQTAFEMVQSNDSPNLANKKSNHDGFNVGTQRKSSRYHEMVSHCLDVWEIMFRFNQISAALKANGKTLAFVPYNIATNMAALVGSADWRHQNVAKTITAFLTAGQINANFNLLPNGDLYFIKIDNTVIGCTSPLTLFFTPEDIISNMRIAGITLNRLDGSAYFTTVVPLHQRGNDFQEYVHRFISAYIRNTPAIANRIKPFFDYTQESLKYLQQTNLILHNTIMGYYTGNFNPNQFTNTYIPVTSDGNTLQSIGLSIYQDNNNIIPNSSFFMDSTKLRVVPNSIPMVLVGGTDFPGWQYWTQTFDKSNVKNQIPYSDNQSLNTRTIPGIPQQYPCLYVNDFLEDKLVVLPYPNNGRFFFNGNLDNPTQSPESYLLPIKDTYFEYFTIDDLKKNIKISKKNGSVDGRPMQEYVEVALTIPLKRGNIVLTRKYVHTPSADNNENLGSFHKAKVTFSVFPFVLAKNSTSIQTTDGQFNQPTIAKTNAYRFSDLYKVMVNYIDPIDKIDFYVNYQPIPFDGNLGFQGKRVYSHLKRIPLTETTAIAEGGGVDVWTVEKTHFDYVKLQFANSVSGLIIPNWIIKTIGTNQNNFTAAIDFGTTNTHVELHEGALIDFDNETTIPTPISFTNQNEDCIIGYLGEFKSRDDIFIPTVISGQIGTGSIKFPTRTATIEQKNFQGKLSVFENISICFRYAKASIPQNEASLLKTNHKWNIQKGNTASEQRVQAIFEELLLLLRTKILLKGGDPSKAKVVWFYPLSMTIYTHGTLDRLWKDFFDKFFNPINTTNLHSITESEAPYYYIAGTLPDLDKSSVLSIDIGGGTTDYVFFANDKPQKAASVYFGANILYGTGYVQIKTPDNQNALMKAYINTCRTSLNALQDNSSTKSDVTGMFQNFSSNGNSVDFINFLFVNEHVFKFTDALGKDEKYKVLFLLYYGAIIYHAAHMMLIEKIACPQYIFFSGNGSRLLKILDPSTSQGTLNEFTKHLLNHFKEITPNYFKGVKMEGNQPKEATCKGGIYSLVKDKTHRPKPFVISGDKENKFKDKTYEEVLQDSSIKQSVKETVMDYIDLFIKLSKELNYPNKFGIKIKDYNIIRGEFEKNSIIYMDNGIQMLRKDDINNPLEETLFFYPFIGAIYALGFALQD